jgi:hypothetical protein
MIWVAGERNFEWTGRIGFSVFAYRRNSSFCSFIKIISFLKEFLATYSI